MKEYDYLEGFIKIIQRIISIAIPMIMIFTVAICISEGFRNFIIPNSALSMWDEVASWTFFLTVLNYILIFIYFCVGIGKLNPYSPKKHTPAVSLAVAYGVANTVLFSYYFYIMFFYDIGMWHLFNIS